MRWHWTIPRLERAARWPKGWPKPSLAPARRLAMLFEPRRQAGPDGLFFSVEDQLPMMGKEYWFLHLSTPDREEQVILTMGRSVGSVRVNRTRLRAEEPTDGVADCAAVCWYWTGGKKRVLLDGTAQVRAGREGDQRYLLAGHGRKQVRIAGSYPDYTLRLQDGERTRLEARITKPEQGVPYEMPHLLKNPLAPRLGAAMVNYYFDFAGTLEGRPLRGKAYMQKVLAVMPLAPWNWIRLSFERGATLDFFVGKPLGDHPITRFEAHGYLQVGSRRLALGEVQLSSWLEGEKRRWVLAGPRVLLCMSTYARQPFSMSQTTRFEYDEYLVRVTELAYSHAGASHTLEDLGAGHGLVEDASGYLF